MWPLTSNSISLLLTGAMRYFLPIRMRTFSSLSDGKKQKYCLVWKIEKKKNLSYSPDEGEKIYSLSLPIFPFSHWPVQVVPSPQSIIFTAVTDGRTADCNYFYRYWGHLEAVSPHWKTEELGSHKGQVFITCSLTWIHRRTLTSNGMHRHKEKSYIFILVRGKKWKRPILNQSSV